MSEVVKQVNRLLEFDTDARLEIEADRPMGKILTPGHVSY